MTRRKAVAILKPAVTWILLADDQQAEIYARQTHARRPCMRHRAEENDPVSVPYMRWKAESQHNSEFSTQIGDALNRAFREREFQRLVMIAPQGMLEELRESLNPKLLRAVLAELPHDAALDAAMRDGYLNQLA